MLVTHQDFRELPAHERRRSLLELIRGAHGEHERRLGVAAAIQGAEVAVLGRDLTGVVHRVGGIVHPCGGRVSDQLGVDTRFAVPTSAATGALLSEARTRGVAIVSERELGEMVEVFVGVQGINELRTAARRARDDASTAATAAAAIRTSAAQPLRSSRMARSERDRDRDRIRQARSSDPAANLPEDERLLQEHARLVRGDDGRAPFHARRRVQV